MEDICNKYEHLSDILEYGNITDEEAIFVCNDIIDKSISENNEQILEAMYHAILTGIDNRKIIKRLNVGKIVKNISKFNEEVLDYIITILAYTGEKKYIKILIKIGEQYGNLDIDDAIKELKYRINYE